MASGHATLRPADSSSRLYSVTANCGLFCVGEYCYSTGGRSVRERRVGALGSRATQPKWHRDPWGTSCDTGYRVADMRWIGRWSFLDDWALKRAAKAEADEDAEDSVYRYSEDQGIYVGPPCMAVMASETNLRILLQQGAFTVHLASSSTIDHDPRFADCLMKLIFPAESEVKLALRS